MLDSFQLTGRSRSHLCPWEDPRLAVHVEVLAPFTAMRAAAANDGIDLAIYSAFRDFFEQARIWNAKFSGARTLYDEQGNAIDYARLSEHERIQCILNWSAVPGASRHHWGSDIDVFDRASMPQGYSVQLLPEEYAPGGVFYRLSEWLARNSARFGFFRPYLQYRGGMFPEPWHLSYASVSVPALLGLTPALVAEAIEQGEILGKEAVLARLPEIFARHVLNVTGPQQIEAA
jgi:LAS superfamily LD-carboxypeptidase LdcB